MPASDHGVFDRSHLAAALVAAGLGDREAFRLVYEHTAAKLFGVCHRICGDERAAEDVLHEVYLTVWRGAGTFRPERASPITWLCAVARNRALDWRRAQAVRGAGSHDRLEAAEEVADDALLADAAAIRDDEHARLRDCMEALEPRQRHALTRAFFDGLTYTQVAERERVPAGTAKSWVRRGLIRLRDCLGGAPDHG